MTAFDWSPFPRTESIGLPPCDRCACRECVLPYYRWERDRNIDLNEDCHVHSPPRDFPALRAEPLWRQTWVPVPRIVRSLTSIYKAQYNNDNLAGYWFPPLRCDRNGPPGPYDLRARNEKWLERIYSSPGCRCDECLANAQTVEIALSGIAWDIAQWPDYEHRCWFGSLETGDQRDNCWCGAEAVIGGTVWFGYAQLWFEENVLRAKPLMTFSGEPVFRRDIVSWSPPSQGRVTLTLTNAAAARIGTQEIFVGLDE